MVALIVLTAITGLLLLGYLAYEVYRDQSLTHAREAGRHQKGYVFRDRERAAVYWYLRSKHKLSRQVQGLEDQLRVERERTSELERVAAEYRVRVKAHG